MPGSLLFGGIASFSVSLADPAGSSPLVAAVRWLEGTLLGTIAVTVAVVCVATIGLMMLSGRVNLRYGATAIMGCFVLFGASAIANGIQLAVTATSEVQLSDAIPPSSGVVIPPSLPSEGRRADPYAGASVPIR